MDNWQFLIQKQGERTWKPLESPKVKLTEGRYRVVAKSNFPNTDVEVRVIHTSFQEGTPKKRLNKRSRRTNSEGLMGVIPFTSLEPGIWKILCSGDVMSDMLGQSWTHSIKLKVLPKAVEVNSGIGGDGGNVNYVSDLADSELQPPRNEFTDSVVNQTYIKDNSVEITINAPEAELTASSATDIQNNTESPDNFGTINHHLQEIAESIGDTVTVNNDREDEGLMEPVMTPLDLKGETAEQILQNLIELAIPASESLLEDEPEADDIPKALPDLPLGLSLDAKTYIAPWGETFSINGRLESKNTPNLQQNRVYGGELHIELRSPQGGEIINEVRQPVAEQLLPFNFTSHVDIPKDCESKLLLGDIYLYGAWERGGEVTLLASQSFSITAEVKELLAISVAQSSQLEVINNTQTASLVIPEASVSLDLELFNLVKTRTKGQFLKTKPSNKKSIPPKIDPRKLRKSSPVRSLKLPNLPNQNQKISRTEVGSQTPTNKLDNLDSGVIREANPSVEIGEKQALLPGKTGTTFPYLKRVQSPQVHPSEDTDICIPPENLSPELDTPEIVPEDTSSPPTPPEETGIAELIVEDNPNLSPLIRQWIYNQGFSLPQPIDVQFQDYDITGEELGVPTELEAESSTDEEFFTAPPPLPPLPPPPAKVKRKQVNWEILAEDILYEPKPELEPETESQQVQESNLSTLQPEDNIPIQPLSTPQLYIPTGELIAGKSVRVRVEIPEIRPLIAVKLWIEDYQTRMLLDGPHLFTDLLPNTSGCLELNTQLKIPLGCLEIRIEAIAIELTTQQESHKVTVIRTVVPEDLPSLRVEELLGIRG